VVEDIRGDRVGPVVKLDTTTKRRKMNMNTIRIKTKSTTTFKWSSSGVRGLTENETEGLRAAVIEAINNFRKFTRGDGAPDGIKACLVTWEDGDALRAFLFDLAGEIPAELPWILMRTEPERVLKSARG
jgi:hypothetical protein